MDKKRNLAQENDHLYKHMTHIGELSKKGVISNEEAYKIMMEDYKKTQKNECYIHEEAFLKRKTSWLSCLFRWSLFLGSAFIIGKINSKTFELVGWSGLIESLKFDNAWKILEYLAIFWPVMAVAYVVYDVFRFAQYRRRKNKLLEKISKLEK